MRVYLGVDRGVNKIYAQREDTDTPREIGHYSDSDEYILGILISLGVTDILPAAGDCRMPDPRFDKFKKELSRRVR